MRPYTNQLKQDIDMRIKNRIDISDLLINIDLKGADLSRAIISKLHRVDSNISGCNFSHCIFGNDKDIITFIRCNMENSNFESSSFIGNTWIRSCNVNNSNFRNSDVSKVSYEYSTFKNTSFCGCVIKLDSRSGIGSTFDMGLLEELTKNWNVNIAITPKLKNCNEK